MERKRDKYKHIDAHAGEVGDVCFGMILKESEVSALAAKTHELASYDEREVHDE